jgi:hypothetical protein
MKWKTIKRELNIQDWHIWWAWHPVTIETVEYRERGCLCKERIRVWLAPVRRRKYGAEWEYCDYDPQEEMMKRLER